MSYVGSNIVLNSFNGIESLSIDSSEIPEHLESNEVLIKNRIFGLNFSDIEVARGSYFENPELPTVAGREASGQIIKKGENVKSWDVGDKIAFYSTNLEGAFREYMKVSEKELNGVKNNSGFAYVKVPDEMSYKKAASIPMQYVTAFVSLTSAAEVKNDDVCLIFAAAGGVGTAILQLLQSKNNVTTIGTSSSDEKLQFAKNNGLDYGINYKEEKIESKVKEYINSGVVDCIFDGVGGQTFKKSMNILSHGGRVATYGSASGRPGYISTLDLLQKNQKVRGVHIQKGPQYISEFGELEILDKLYNGALSQYISPKISKTYSLDEFKKGYRLMQEGDNIGKIVIGVS